MSFETIEEKRVKARKEHMCSWCNSVIKVGEEYKHQKNVTEGNIHSWKECDRCKKLVKEMFELGYGENYGYCTADDFDEFMDNEYGMYFQEYYSKNEK